VNRRALGIVLAVLAAGAGIGVALAQSSSANFSVPRQSIDGGAQRASSATFAVNGTVGQPVAGSAMSGATFSLRGGFHRSTPDAAPGEEIFRNGFES
jgi:hypothetical protein